MKLFIPTTPRQWGAVGMMVVTLIAIFAKSPLWLGVAALLYVVIYGLVRRTTAKAGRAASSAKP